MMVGAAIAEVVIVAVDLVEADMEIAVAVDIVPVVMIVEVDIVQAAEMMEVILKPVVIAVDLVGADMEMMEAAVDTVPVVPVAIQVAVKGAIVPVVDQVIAEIQVVDILEAVKEVIVPVEVVIAQEEEVLLVDIAWAVVVMAGVMLNMENQLKLLLNILLNIFQLQDPIQ